MLSKIWGYWVPLSLNWNWVEMKCFGVVYVFSTKCSLIFLSSYFWSCFNSSLNRYLTRVWVSTVISYLFIGRAGDPRHISDGNLWTCFIWTGECTIVWFDPYMVVVLESFNWMTVNSVWDESVLYHSRSLICSTVYCITVVCYLYMIWCRLRHVSNDFTMISKLKPHWSLVESSRQGFGRLDNVPWVLLFVE